MKKLSINKLILVGLISIFSACTKEPAIHTVYTPGEDPNTVSVKNNQVSVKLIALEVFSNPCFIMSFNSAFLTSFRFNGSYVQWDFTNLAPGLHAYSFSCLHECSNENGAERMKFEIYDGLRYYEVSTRETDHCKYEFWLNVI